jgi:hypothetical protein
MPRFRWRSALSGKFIRAPRGWLAGIIRWFSVRERA